MSLVTWNDQCQPRQPWLQMGGLLAIWLFCGFGGTRLVAGLWTPHLPGLIAWWPGFGWGMAAPLIAFLIVCSATALLKRLENPAPVLLTVFWLSIAGCLAACVWDSLNRTEVHRDVIVLHRPFQPDRRFRPDQIVRLEVSCYNGSRGGADPGMVATTTDGARIDVAEEAIGWNGPRPADWLIAAETVSGWARARDLWRVEVNGEGRSSLYTGCMRRLIERYPEQDRGRVIALFRP